MKVNRPCRKCGATDRYKNGACRPCAIERAKKPGKEKLKEKSAEYRRKNPEKAREIVRNSHKKYRSNNKEKLNEKASRERARKRMAIPKWFGEFDDLVCKEAFSLARERERETGIKWDVDHIVPLACKTACGLHCAENLRVIPASLNRSRRNNYEG